MLLSPDTQHCSPRNILKKTWCSIWAITLFLIFFSRHVAPQQDAFRVSTLIGRQDTIGTSSQVVNGIGTTAAVSNILIVFSFVTLIIYFLHYLLIIE